MTGLLLFLLLFHADAVSRKPDTSLSPVFSLVSDKLASSSSSLLPLISSDWAKNVENELKQHAHAVQQPSNLDSTLLPSFQSLVSQFPPPSFSSPILTELSSSATLRTKASVPNEPLQSINSLVSVTSQLPSLNQIQQIQVDIQSVDHQRALLQGYSNVAEQAMQSSTLMASILRDNVTQAVAQVLSNKDKLLSWIEQQKQGVVSQLNEEERHMNQLTAQSKTVTQAVEEANQKLMNYHKLQDQLVTERQLQTTSPSNPSVERAMLPLSQFQQTLTQLMSFQHAATQVIDQGTQALQQLSFAYQTSARWYVSTRAILKAWLENCQQAVTNELMQAKDIVGQAREQWSQYSSVYNQAHALHERYQNLLSQLVAKRAALQNARGNLVTSEVEKTDMKRQQLMTQIAALSTQLQQSNQILTALQQTAVAASIVPAGTVPTVPTSPLPSLSAISPPNNLPKLAELLQPTRFPQLNVQQRNGFSLPQLSSQSLSSETSSSSSSLPSQETLQPDVSSSSSLPSLSAPSSSSAVSSLTSSETISSNPVQSPIDENMLANLQDTTQPFRAN